ncbi:hypothetical protein HYFRA_00012222 [Hymenoscyphus fraxineus]|uniref:Fungal N-terminal domain-containing protein n=1 Tax=Hymenoscyphus fraxineus TaxID=746836 RepID=A0A9N9PVG6_9HELO|nr:hypothetical protein HYFRA_00012222 [Hymenoscyphus fraxineus]
MDPISVTASVVGLLSGAAKIAGVLHKVKSSIVDAPKSLGILLSQINDLSTCLAAVDQFLTGIHSAPTNRFGMIQVDQLVATLTEAVLTFSELELLVTPLGNPSEISIIKRMKWAWKEEIISSIMTRLHRHKFSFSLMLNIIQCTTNLEAQQSRERLNSLIQTLLQGNRDISNRLHQMEFTFDTESTLTSCFRNTRRAEDVDSTTHTIRQDNSPDPSVSDDFYTVSQTGEYRFSFEVVLGKSRVYKRTQHYSSDVSFTSSAVRTHAWSIISGLSLSQVSNLSAIALPIYTSEIYNYEHYQVEPGTPTGIPQPLGGGFATPEFTRLSSDANYFDREQQAEQPSSITPTFCVAGNRKLSSVIPIRTVDVTENGVNEPYVSSNISYLEEEHISGPEQFYSESMYSPISVGSDDSEVQAFSFDSAVQVGQVQYSAIKPAEINSWPLPQAGLTWKDSSTLCDMTNFTSSSASLSPRTSDGCIISEMVEQRKAVGRCDTGFYEEEIEWSENDPAASVSARSLDHASGTPENVDNHKGVEKGTYIPAHRLALHRIPVHTTSVLKGVNHVNYKLEANHPVISRRPIDHSLSSAPPSQKDKLFIVVLLGDGCVGKTTLASQFCYNTFPKPYVPTIEGCYEKRLDIGGHSATLHVLDSGIEEYPMLRMKELQFGEAFMLIYSITDKGSFGHTNTPT